MIPSNDTPQPDDTDLRDTVLSLLMEVAPDVEPDQIEPDIRFRDQFDFDSMDQLNFAIALHKRFGIEIPEADYARLDTLAGCEAYLRERLKAA